MHLGDFSASHSTQLTESFEAMVSANVPGKLPNLQYFASASGGRILKGRFTILDLGEAGAAPAPTATPLRPQTAPMAVRP